MAFKLEDGTGSGHKQKVTSNNRAQVEAIVEQQADHHAELGYKFNINTGDLTLTTACESALLYLKNNENDDIIISSFIYNLGNAVGACCAAISNQDILVDVYKNPTAGTVVSCAVAVQMNANMNFGSPITLCIDAYKGGEGKTLTDGCIVVATRVPGYGRNVIDLGSVVIPKGKSVGVKLTPPTGNTSMTVQIALAIFLQKLDI